MKKNNFNQELPTPTKLSPLNPITNRDTFVSPISEPGRFQWLKAMLLTLTQFVSPLAPCVGPALRDFERKISLCDRTLSLLSFLWL